MAVSARRCGDLLSLLRDKRPLVHNITNAVAMDISANVLLALGASPAMIMAPEEVEDFAAVADCLVANIGTLSVDSIKAMRLAATTMNGLGKPWVLDPVGCGATPFRLAAARGLVDLKPTIIRGNPGEIASLCGAVGASRGVDTLMSADEATKDAVSLARLSGSVVAMTGETDYVADGATMLTVAGGAAVMPYVTALGCSLSASVAAFAAVADSPLEAAVAALAMFGVVGAHAARQSDAPASFRTAFIDGLYRLEPDALAAEAEIGEVTGLA
jgi:hydroxyethylthiazole kinase